MRRALRNIVLLIAGFILLNAQALAQGCVNCRTQIESSEQNELTVGNGINAGITILMVAPYILLAVAFYFIFGKRIMYFFKDLLGMWKK